MGTDDQLPAGRQEAEAVTIDMLPSDLLVSLYLASNWSVRVLFSGIGYWNFVNATRELCKVLISPDMTIGSPSDSPKHALCSIFPTQWEIYKHIPDEAQATGIRPRLVGRRAFVEVSR